ncbi:MAG: cas6 [Bacteroidetes bacterium]|nr:cas6 [Bacteroidota bacterium]
MRFKISLSIDKAAHGNALPFNYQYEISAFIYHTLAKGDAVYAQWLHQNGFETDGKKFRLFIFSPLSIDKISIDKTNNRLLLLSDRAELLISFLTERSTEEFVKGIFAEQLFTLGDRQSKVQFKVQGIEMLPPPRFDGVLTGNLLSPLCLSRKNEEGKLHYFSAADPDAGRAIFNNLTNKYEAFYGKPFEGNNDFDWQTLDEPRTKLITIKAGTPQKTRIRASLCRFRLKADNELLRIGYEAGLGEKGSLGFGFLYPEGF